MFARIFGSSVSFTFFRDQELQTTFVAIIDFTLFHFCAMDHSNLLIFLLAFDYIQQESIIK